MKHCNACQQFAVGRPTYCPFCGKTYDVRICARGHRNARSAEFCPECGSHDLSEPAPPDGPSVRASRLALKAILAVALLALALSTVVGILSSLDSLAAPILLLMLVYAFTQWTTALLPDSMRKLATAAGRRALRAMKG